MATHDEYITGHQVWTELNSMDAAIAALERRLVAGEATDPEAAELTFRAQAIARYARTRMSQLEPAIVPKGPFDAIEACLVSLVSSLDGVAGSDMQASIVSAHHSMDNLLRSFDPLPQPVTSAEFSFTGQDFTRVRQTAGALIASLQRDAKALSNDVTEAQQNVALLRKQTDAQVDTVDAAVARADTRVLDAITRMTDDATRNETARKETTDATISAHSREWSADRTAQRDEFNEEKRRLESEVTAEIAARKKEFEDAAVDIDLKATNQRDDTLRKANQTLGQLDRKLEQASNIVEILSNSAVAGAYTTSANDERGVANRWSWLAVVLFLAGALASIWLTTRHHSDDPLIEVLLRLGPAATFLLVAGFAARQSAIHRTRESTYRARALELAALPGYLDSLHEDVQARLKAGLASRYFRGDVGEASELTLPDISKQDGDAST